MVAAYDRRAAVKMTRRLDAVFKRLAKYPLSGQEWAELGEGLRRALSGINVIIYRIEAEEIIILRVIDGRMDVEAEFQE